jgi:argininosuccinate lyase
VGSIDEEVLAFTAGRDIDLDRRLVEADCLGTAAHVSMLARIPVKPRLMSARERRAVIRELLTLIREARDGRFRITVADQDVHLAVERRLTEKLGDVGRRVHTARSRNDQASVDLRLYSRVQLALTVGEVSVLSAALLRVASRHRSVPMVGRTHQQKAMPSTVGLWASAHAESLLDDAALLTHVAGTNNHCPLGSAAGYGVPLPIDRQLVSDLLGFSRPIHNVLYASNARGKMESVILSALGQAMVSLSRLAQDLILYSMPEFGYFRLPPAFCTGSSIMPNKCNPDVLELMRARAAVVLGLASRATEIVRAAPSGYNRDVQETKAPLMEGLDTTRACLRILPPMLQEMQVDREALRAGFTPEVFATDRALALASAGMPFREAYRQVRQDLDGTDRAPELDAAIRARTHLGGAGALDLAALRRRATGAARWSREALRAHRRAACRLMGVRDWDRLDPV